jgi:hypothetical protein
MIRSILLLLFLMVIRKGDAQVSRTGDVADSILRIEMYGETGKGDTAIVFHKNGTRKKVFLQDEKAKRKFFAAYKNALPNHRPEAYTEARPQEHTAKADIVVPDDIVEYTYNPGSVKLKLKNGKKEFYDLNDPVQKRNFIDKYQNFLGFEDSAR